MTSFLEPPAFCGTHTAVVMLQGGLVTIGEVPLISQVRWTRVRDDISTAQIDIPIAECCDLLNLIEVVRCELHIFRDGTPVWEGVISRLEFEYDQAQIFAEDMLWVAKNRALSAGYNYQEPGLGLPYGPVYGFGEINAVQHMDNLLRLQCYNQFGDHWKMLPHLFPIFGPEDPGSQRQANAWSTTVWAEFDKIAEDYGTDYTVVNRDIFYFDNHLAWAILPDLATEDVSTYPRVVEYGNSFASRFIRTDGSGYASMAVAPVVVSDRYGRGIDVVSNETSQATTDALPDPDSPPPPPSPAKFAAWMRTADRQLPDLFPPRQAIVVAANSTLMPSSPWNINTLTPGSWFQITVDYTCRPPVTDWQRLESVTVTETGDDGEVVNFTAGTAPSRKVDPL